MNKNENENESKVKYPQVTVKLTGKDSNVFNLIGLVAAELRRVVGNEAAAEFVKGTEDLHSYDEALAYFMRTVNVI